MADNKLKQLEDRLLQVEQEARDIRQKLQNAEDIDALIANLKKNTRETAILKDYLEDLDIELDIALEQKDSILRKILSNNY